jgi:glycosyl transferase family 28
MMRGLNIAREIRVLNPAAQVLFYLHSAPSEELWPEEIPYVADSDSESLALWPETLRSFSPQVVVYDTILPKDREPVIDSARYAYIMRKCQQDKQMEVFRNPFLDRVSAILVPHTREEFGYALPPAIAHKTAFVGPIARMPDAQVQQHLREKYGIHPGDFLLTSTVGGGGFTEQAQAFFEKVLAVHRHLHGALPRLRHLVIRGPNFAGALPAAEGMTVIEVEPQMIDLLAISDLAIAEGGYNTVSEIRITKTPAVFLPSTRGKDDQEERVRVLEWMGLAYVLSDLPPDELARKVLQICSCPRCLAEIRERYRADRFCPGNRAAAQRLLDLAR